MFEGSEKKLEIIFSKEIPSLRSLSSCFWKKVVKASDAEIISVVNFSKVDSYILSESSLFVWDHRIIMITCGRTTLPKSLLKILKKISEDKMEVLFYQRKNELFSQIQKSTFFKDLEVIQKKIKGKSYQFGPLHQHHFFLFHTESDYKCESDDQTLEILMYDSDFIKDTSKETLSRLKEKLSMCFLGFEIHDHTFQPDGYSLNAVREDLYYTIHITPQKSFFYISFETNIKNDFHKSISSVLNIFRSNHFDLILFYPAGYSRKSYKHETLQRNVFVHQILETGYAVDYMNFGLVQNTFQKPLDLGEKNVRC